MIDHILYVGADDVKALTISPTATRTALTHAFKLHAEGRTLIQPKQTLSIEAGHYFQSMSAAARPLAFAASKWIGVVAANAERGLATIDGLVILSDLETGLPVAIVDGNSLTVMRTAAMSALAAVYLARPDSTSIGFVGCGLEARGHLAAMRDVLPELREAVCVSRGASSREHLAGAARKLGLAAKTSTDAKEALGCDVVVSSVPGSAGLIPFLDARLLHPGTFVSAVDLGRSWQPRSFEAFDILATDDHTQSSDPANRAKLAYPGPFDADLAQFVTGAVAGRSNSNQRTLFLFPGFALADLAIAAEIYSAAVCEGRGIRLPR